MNWFVVHRRSAWICGLTLLLPFLLYLKVFFGLWGVRSDYQESIERVEPRMARLAGLLAREEELSAASVQLRQTMNALVYPPNSEPNAVSAALQKDIRQLADSAGLSVTNSQLLPVRQEADFDFVGVKLTVTGELEDLDEILAAIRDYKPRLLVSSLEIFPRRGRRGQPETQTVQATLELFSMRELM